jgi:hypothetical protein
MQYRTIYARPTTSHIFSASNKAEDFMSGITLIGLALLKLVMDRWQSHFCIAITSIL